MVLFFDLLFSFLFSLSRCVVLSILIPSYLIFHFRYSRSNRNIIQSEDEIENFHFRRRPTSFLCNTDPKRFTWMTAAEQDMAAANADGLRYFHFHLFYYFRSTVRCCCCCCRRCHKPNPPILVIHY